MVKHDQAPDANRWNRLPLPGIRSGTRTLPASGAAFVPLTAYDPIKEGGWIEVQCQDAYVILRHTVTLDAGQSYVRTYRMGPASRLTLPAGRIDFQVQTAPTVNLTVDPNTGLIAPAGALAPTLSWTWWPFKPADLDQQAITGTVNPGAILNVAYPPGYADEFWIGGADSASTSQVVLRLNDQDVFLGQLNFATYFLPSLSFLPCTPWTRIDIQNGSGVNVLSYCIIWRRRSTAGPG